MSMVRTSERKHGFTLLELLMVVVIIAILASIALPQYIRASEKARSTEALTALGALRSAELRYKALNPKSIYTTNIGELDVEFANSNNPSGALTGWGAINGTNITVGLVGTVAVGSAQYARNSGEFTGQTVGIQFGTGTLCGNFEPLGFSNVCTDD